MNQRAEKTLFALEREVGLALTLHWIGDRYAQRIFLLQQGERRLLAVSGEADAATCGDEIADLPAFQELSIEPIGGGEAACLVGMSGRDYWSAAVENLAAQRALRFDLCRKGENADRLACRYEIVGGAATVLDHNGAVIRIDEALQCVIQLEPVGGMEARLRLDAGRLFIESRRAGGAAPLRCKFTWRIEAGGDTRAQGNSL